MFPYPSGAGLHVGHPEGYTATDILARYKRAVGFNVLHPMGWDAFGLPAEQYAVKTGQHPRTTTEQNIATFKRQIQSLGFSYDWSRELATTDPDYFKWTQWIFLKLYNSWFNPETNQAEPIETLEYPAELCTGRDALPRVQADQQVGPTILKISDATLGEIYLVNHPRLASFPLPAKRGEGENMLSGFELFIPHSSLGAVADKLIAAAKSLNAPLAAPKRSVGGCGWQAFDTARIEAGIPRFGADMDETNLPLECGIENSAISYKKGCYIGQEVINRIHSFGHVAKELSGLRLTDDLESLPQRRDKLFYEGKEVGYITSAVKSPDYGNIALGYVRREANQIGTGLILKTVTGERTVKIVSLPFVS